MSKISRVLFFLNNNLRVGYYFKNSNLQGGYYFK